MFSYCFALLIFWTASKQQSYKEPATRAALNILKSTYANTSDFIVSLFDDTLLKRKLKLFVFDTRSLHHEYAKVHALHKDGLFIQYQTDRSRAKTYLKTCSEMMEKLTGNDFSTEMRIGGDPRGDATLLQLHWAFSFDLIENRIWSQSMFTMCFPWCMAMVFVENKEDMIIPVRVLGQRNGLFGNIVFFPTSGEARGSFRANSREVPVISSLFVNIVFFFQPQEKLRVVSGQPQGKFQ